MRQVAEAGRLRFASLTLSTLVVALFVFAVSWGGFGLISSNKIPFAGAIVGLLFGSLFFTLGVMLTLSTGLIVYASLFSSPESRFLLTTPARADRIFAAKFRSAVAFSSWGFLVLGGPILFAYGIAFDVPWHYYLFVPVVCLGYTLLPGAAGSIAALLLINFFPQRRKQALIAFGMILLSLAGYWGYLVVVAAKKSADQRDNLQSLFDLFSLATSPYSPSQWVARSLMASAQGDYATPAFLACLLWANGLMAYLIAAWLAKRLLRRGFDRMASGGAGNRGAGGHGLDRFVSGVLPLRDPELKALFVKDFRTFRREPAQVGQLAVFAGLLLLCVANSRQFFRADAGENYVNGISLLNLSAIGLLTCAYLGRFVYPLISLEGRKFWILGLLPLKRSKLLWSKFIFALAGTLAFGASLTLLGDLVLGVRPELVVAHFVTMVMICVGASGLTVGLSACLPNFRETDPSKIVVGFGGTVSMVLSILFPRHRDLFRLRRDPYRSVTIGRWTPVPAAGCRIGSGRAS